MFDEFVIPAQYHDSIYWSFVEDNDYEVKEVEVEEIEFFAVEDVPF